MMVMVRKKLNQMSASASKATGEYKKLNLSELKSSIAFEVQKDK